MEKEKPTGEHYVPVWGIFLLFLGIVLLLQSLNVIPWALWGTLWHFWPVLLIIAGLSLLLRRFNVWLVSILLLAVLFACLGLALWQQGASPPTTPGATSYSEPLDTMDRAQIEIEFTAGSLTMSHLSPTSTNLVEVGTGAGTGNAGIRADFSRTGNQGRLQLSKNRVNPPFWDDNDNTWQVNLTGNVPLTLNIKSAASNLELNLKELKVTELQLDLGAGNCEVIMPTPTGTTVAYIKADVANTEVNMPEGVPAKIKIDSHLSAFEINRSRFPKQGDYYISDGFDSAQNRIYLEIEGDVGRIAVK